MSGFAFTKMHGCGNDYVFIDVFSTVLGQTPGRYQADLR